MSDNIHLPGLDSIMITLSLDAALGHYPSKRAIHHLYRAEQLLNAETILSPPFHADALAHIIAARAILADADRDPAERPDLPIAQT